ncbi:MAG: glycoside hydrolase family 3 C-terminal domain-containing protein, partial [Micromonosporaceae bacterium]|nr:glycoside hydrolase family 3 C-terminal domain-containing protein [Micromonosporaceae bacterium]
PATVFPQAVGLASTWNPALVRRVGEAVGEEARGFHHKDPDRAGLNVWAPVVNQLRDPRWGRNEEGYAEDPLLTATLATAYAQGLRGSHPVYLRTAPTLKHFLGYNNETRRDTTSSNLPPRVLHEYELPAFRAPLQAGAAVAVMASYNLVNGRPAHLSNLIRDALRAWTADEVVVVSDAYAPSNVAATQHYYADHTASHAALVKAGLDSFTDNDERSQVTIDRLTEALRLGLLDESDVDGAVRRLLAIRFRLGEFDDPAGNPFAAITEEVVNCPAHQEIAAQAAREAMVLLKNDGLLPARPASVAVIGPLADTLYEDWYSGTLPYVNTAASGLAGRLGDSAVRRAEGNSRIVLRVADGAALAGRYLSMSDAAHGAPVGAQTDTPGPAAWIDLDEWGEGVVALRAYANGRYLTVDTTGDLVNEAPRPGGWVVRETFQFLPRGAEQTVIKHPATGRYLMVGLDGVARAVAESTTAASGFIVEPVCDGVAAAVTAASEADLAVVVLGNHPLINGRETEDRVDLQLPPAQDRLLRAVCAANPRTVLVLNSSYPYAIGWAAQHVPAILWSAHGGQEFGRALAEVLLGDAAPAGRLTQTWYRSAAELPDLLDYDIIASDATYLYYRGTPLYPFGHGLTYSEVEYADLSLSDPHCDAQGEITVSVRVTNTGNLATDEVVQLYTRQRRSRVKQPLRQLRGFQRISLHAGASKTVHFRLKAADLAFWDVTRGRLVVEDATHAVMVGRSSVDIRCAAILAVTGETIPPRHPGRLYAIDFDDYAGIRLVDADPVTGDAVCAIEPGAWICFAGVNLDGCMVGTAELSRTGTGPAGVTLRLDDPLDGPVIGTIEVSCTGGRYRWETGTTQLVDADGVRDLFAVFAATGVNLRSLSLQAAHDAGTR